MMETSVRVLYTGRQFTEYAVAESRQGRQPLRTEVVRHRKLDSYYCRSCHAAGGGLASACRHIDAVRRALRRAHLLVLK